MTRKSLPVPRSLSDSPALWKRATELDQATRSSGEPDSFQGGDASGLPVPELLAVAREVGISPDSVLLSVVEERLPDGGALRPPGTSPLWHQVLVETWDAVEVPVHLAVDPGEALRLLDEILARPEYRMVPEDRIRVEESGETASVFRAGEAQGFFRSSSFHGAMHVADGRVLLASIVGEGCGGSRVRIRMPTYERGMNLALSAGAGGLGGAGCANAGAALGEAAVAGLLGGGVGLLPLAAVVVPAVLGGYAGVGFGVLAFRRLQKWGYRKGEEALKRLARLLEMEARREG
ncbi:MAG: hypothetical protein EA422_13110 [Gemmatimonadales bacterium]|nr:MAG: hypothetical protein EA422_13110 [Gemmatimonadales bacterium]